MSAEYHQLLRLHLLLDIAAIVEDYAPLCLCLCRNFPRVVTTLVGCDLQDCNEIFIKPPDLANDRTRIKHVACTCCIIFCERCEASICQQCCKTCQCNAKICSKCASWCDT